MRKVRRCFNVLSSQHLGQLLKVLRSKRNSGFLIQLEFFPLNLLHKTVLLAQYDGRYSSVALWLHSMPKVKGLEIRENPGCKISIQQSTRTRSHRCRWTTTRDPKLQIPLHIHRLWNKVDRSSVDDEHQRRSCCWCVFLSMGFKIWHTTQTKEVTHYFLRLDSLPQYFKSKPCSTLRVPRWYYPWHTHTHTHTHTHARTQARTLQCAFNRWVWKSSRSHIL